MLRDTVGVSIGWLAISMVADGLPALLLPHRLLADGATASTLGLVTLGAIGVAALVQPAAGWVSDRVGRFPVIGVGTAAAVGGLALLLVPGAPVAGTVVALAGVSVAQAGQQALLPDRIGPRWRGRAGGLKSAFDVAGAFAGFLVLAALLGGGHAGWAAGALGAALILGALLTRALIPAGSTPADRRQPALGRPSGGSLARLVAARFLFLIGIYAVGRFLLLFVAERFDLGADAAGGEAGMILALLALATAGASLPCGWLADRVGRKPLMLAGGGMGAVGIGLLPTVGSLEAVLGFGMLIAIGSAAFGSASWALLADLTPAPDAGRLMGLANVGTAGAAAAAGLFGLVVDGAGFPAAFHVAALCSLAGGVLAWTLRDGCLPANGLIPSPEGAR